MAPLNCAIFIIPFDASFTFLYLILANFVIQLPNSRCHSNRGRSDVNSNDTGKLLDLENPLFGATFVVLFLVLAEF